MATTVEIDAVRGTLDVTKFCGPESDGSRMRFQLTVRDMDYSEHVADVILDVSGAEALRDMLNNALPDHRETRKQFFDLAEPWLDRGDDRKIVLKKMGVHRQVEIVSGNVKEIASSPSDTWDIILLRALQNIVDRFR